MVQVMDGTFASPSATAKYAAVPSSTEDGILSLAYNGMNGWSAVLTLFLMLVAYDQCKFSNLQAFCRVPR